MRARARHQHPTGTTVRALAALGVLLGVLLGAPMVAFGDPVPDGSAPPAIPGLPGPTTTTTTAPPLPAPVGDVVTTVTRSLAQLLGEEPGPDPGPDPQPDPDPDPDPGSPPAGDPNAGPGPSGPPTGGPAQAPMASPALPVPAAGTPGLPTIPLTPLPMTIPPIGDAGLPSAAPAALGTAVPYRGSMSFAPGPRSTVDLMAILRGINATPATLARVLAPFPVAGDATYSDDWGAPRYTPEFHAHQGTDIFADRGTPVIASSDGTIERMSSGPDAGAGGTSLRLTAADGTFFYYAHLDAFAPGIKVGQAVTKGTVLGFVGDTGNAVGTPPHLHYEIHPAGGAAVPPVPYLDRWLSEARATARTLSAAPANLFSLRSTSAAVAKSLPAGAKKTADAIQVRSAAAARASTTDPIGFITLLTALTALAALRRNRRRRFAEIRSS